MKVARISSGVVVNIESADQDWIDANQGVGGFEFVAYTDDNPAVIGLGYDPVTGFEQPTVPE